MKRVFIVDSDLCRMIEKLLERSDVFAPAASEDRIFFENITPALVEKIVYSSPRPIDPPKTFLYPSREIAARYFSDDNGQDQRPVTIIGIKGCDAAAIKAFDSVMLEGEFADPNYSRRRASSLLIGTDCASINPSCFCTKVGVNPYPESTVDINLSRVEGGFVAAVLTEKGEGLLREFSFFFRECTREEISEMEEIRLGTAARLEDSNKKFNWRLPPHESVKATLDSAAWGRITKYCVECGACNIACPTCTCFQFRDQASGDGFERKRLWDACLKGGYAKTAGGGNSRPFLKQRYNNRIQCKFDYSFDRLGAYTCTGCGRCIDSCPAKIDMREAIGYLEIAMALSAKLE